MRPPFSLRRWVVARSLPPWGERAETIEFALEQEDGCSLQETWSPEYSVTHHACDITCVNNSLPVDTSDCIVDEGAGGAGGGR
jgi:hypothetical protein